MYISAAFIKISLSIIDGEYTKHKSSLIERVTHHLADEKPLSKPMVTKTTPPYTWLRNCVRILHDI